MDSSFQSCFQAEENVHHFIVLTVNYYIGIDPALYTSVIKLIMEQYPQSQAHWQKSSFWGHKTED